jgi:hypothetical protein
MITPCKWHHISATPILFHEETDMGNPPRSLSELGARPVKIAVLLLALAASGSASAAAMPAGSRAWMVFTGNSCGPTDQSLCTTSNTLGPNPPNGIPTSAFIGSGGPYEIGSAEILPGQMRSFNSGYGGSHIYTSMFDTYTVHGLASGPFGITVHLVVNGVARAIPMAGTYGLSGGAVAIEIGNFDSATNNIDERSRVAAFDSSTEAMYIAPSGFSSAAPFEHNLMVATSHSRTVSVGDIFDIGYNVSTDMVWGEIDLLHTAVIRFDLPDGVYLTSILGGRFGDPGSAFQPIPAPSTALLLAVGLPGLRAAGRPRRAD